MSSLDNSKNFIKWKTKISKYLISIDTILSLYSCDQPRLSVNFIHQTYVIFSHPPVDTLLNQQTCVSIYRGMNVESTVIYSTVI